MENKRELKDEELNKVTGGTIPEFGHRAFFIAFLSVSIAGLAKLFTSSRRER